MPKQGIISSPLPQAPIKPFNANAPSTLQITPPAQPTLSPIQPQQSAPQSTAQPINVDGSQLDPSVVALMHGLKTSEGALGNYNAVGDKGTAAGVGQWSNQVNGKVQPLQPGQIPTRFQSDATQFGLDPKDFSPENQNKVLYAVLAQDKANGLTPEQALSKWNSGDPNKYSNAATSTGTGQVGSYDVASYVQKGMSAAQQYAAQNAQNAPAQGASQGPEETPSLGGFGTNIIKSGANFLGNTADALLHPIQTIQNIGGTAVGALQELGGQQNDNTDKFDNFKNYFVQKYGGIDNIEHSLYTDPVGVLGDVSAALGIGGGVIGVLGKVGELSGLETASDVAKTASNVLRKGAEYTNPLSLPVKGVGYAANKLGSATAETVGGIVDMKGQTVKDIFTGKLDAETIANTTRASVAEEIKNALDKREASLSETGIAYEAIKAPGEISAGYENITNTPPENAIPVSRNFLEEQIRSVGKLNVEDGEIKPTTTSKVGKSELGKLQDVMDTFKPAFQRGYLTPEEFLTLRKRLDAVAYNDSGIKNTNLADIAVGLRTKLNETYRGAIPGLEEADNNFSQQISEFKKLRKGILDKDGNLLDSAVNKIANAGNKGRGQVLDRLEEIQPGITKKIELLKSIEDIGKEKWGDTNNLLKAGGLLGSAAAGRLDLVALSIASMIISKPSVAIPLIRSLGANKELAGLIVQHLTQYITLGSRTNLATGTQSQNQQPMPMNQDTQQPQPQTKAGTQPQFLSSSDLTQLATNKKFDLSAARKAGYSDTDIQQFLESQ